MTVNGDPALQKASRGAKMYLLFRNHRFIWIFEANKLHDVLDLQWIHLSPKSRSVNRYKYRGLPVTNRVYTRERAIKRPCNATIIAIFYIRNRVHAAQRFRTNNRLLRFTFYAVTRQIRKRTTTKKKKQNSTYMVIIFLWLLRHHGRRVAQRWRQCSRCIICIQNAASTWEEKRIIAAIYIYIIIMYIYRLLHNAMCTKT